MLLLLLLILVFLLGLEITIILGVKVGLSERLSLSFLLGIGISTFVVFLLAYIFNLNFSFTNTFVTLISLCITAFVVKYKEIISFFRDIKFKKIVIKPKIVIFWGFILAIFTYTLLVNSFWPVSDWDALALYDFRAKVFLIDTNLIHAALSNEYFIQYPLLTSLVHLFVYQVGLGNPKFIYSLFYLSFIIIFYYSLRRHVSKNKAILFTIILSLVPEMLSNATIAYTNLAYTVYLCSGTFYLYDWIKKKKHSSLLLSAILVGLSSWVRITEPFWLVPLFVVFVYIFKDRKWKELIYYLITILTFYLPWELFMKYINVPVFGVINLPYLEILKYIDFGRLLLVFGYLYNYVFSTWGLIFILFLVVILKAIVNWRGNNNVFLYITLLFLVFVFVGTLVFSTIYPGWQDISDSTRRMSIFLLPLIIFSISHY
jgi:hypothetical protein